MTSEVLVRDSETTQGYHVVIMREKLEKTREDRYIVSIAEALKKSGHFVTILTTSFNRNDCLPELEVNINLTNLDINKIYLMKIAAGFK